MISVLLSHLLFALLAGGLGWLIVCLAPEERT